MERERNLPESFRYWGNPVNVFVAIKKALQQQGEVPQVSIAERQMAYFSMIDQCDLLFDIYGNHVKTFMDEDGPDISWLVLKGHPNFSEVVIDKIDNGYTITGIKTTKSNLGLYETKDIQILNVTPDEGSIQAIKCESFFPLMSSPQHTVDEGVIETLPISDANKWAANLTAQLQPVHSSR